MANFTRWIQRLGGRRAPQAANPQTVCSTPPAEAAIASPQDAQDVRSHEPATSHDAPHVKAPSVDVAPHPAASYREGDAEITDRALTIRTFKMEVYERLAETSILSTLPPFLEGTRVALDVGGNVGHIAYFLAQHVHHVYSFEAVGAVYKQLQKVVERAGNIRTEKCAIADFCGEADLFIDHNRLSNSGLHDVGSVDVSFKPATEFKTAKTKVKTIDSLDLEYVGFIKIDVEGSELDVLKGAQLTIDRFGPDLLVEIYEPFCKYPAEKIFDFCFRRKYDCYYFDNEQKRLVNVPCTLAGIHAIQHDHHLHDGDFLFTRKAFARQAAA